MRSRKTGAAVRRVGESLAGGKWGRGNGQAVSGPGRGEGALTGEGAREGLLKDNL